GGEESDVGGGRERDQVARIDLRGDVPARRHHDVDRPGRGVAEDFARVGEGEVERGRAYRGHRQRRQRDRRAEERGEGDGHEVAAGLGGEGARRVHLVGREEDADLVARVDEGRVHRADAGGVVGEPRRAVAPLDRLRGHTRTEEANPQSERGEPRAGLVRQSQQLYVPPWSLRGRRDCRAALYSLSTGPARFGTAPRRVSISSASLGGACWCNRDHGMTSSCGACARLTGLLALLALAGRAAAQTGDSLCESTADTCVIAADQTLPDGSMLTFTAPNVRVRSTLTVGFTARCAPDPATACASDADCAPPARCLRTAQLTIEVAGLLTLDASAKIIARGLAAAGDTIGPDGGTITLSAHDVNLAGSIRVPAEAQGTLGVPAGHAGRIAIDADGTVMLAPTAFLDASTSSGGCGGTIGIGNGAKTPATLSAAGLLVVDGATFGGTIH